MIDKIDILIQRVTELESREVFHEATIDTLNDELIRQQKSIDQLTALTLMLSEKLREGGGESSLVNQGYEKPPHY